MEEPKEPLLLVSRRDAKHMLHELVELVAALKRVETRLRLALRNSKGDGPRQTHD